MRNDAAIWSFMIFFFLFVDGPTQNGSSFCCKLTLRNFGISMKLDLYSWSGTSDTGLKKIKLFNLLFVCVWPIQMAHILNVHFISSVVFLLNGINYNSYLHKSSRGGLNCISLCAYPQKSVLYVWKLCANRFKCLVAFQ